MDICVESSAAVRFLYGKNLKHFCRQSEVKSATQEGNYSEGINHPSVSKFKSTSAITSSTLSDQRRRGAEGSKGNESVCSQYE